MWSPAPKEYVEKSVERTTRWLKRCVTRLDELNRTEDTINKDQILFGINQGGVYEDIRIEHAKVLRDMDLPGYAIGGLAVGESHDEMYRIIEETERYFPKDKPLYLMGVGLPENILESVGQGYRLSTAYCRQETEGMVMFLRDTEDSTSIIRNMKGIRIQ